MRIFAHAAILSALVILPACQTDKPTVTDDGNPPQNSIPVCSVISPADGDTVVIGDINISVEAFDSDGNIESVKFYIDDFLLFSDSEPPYTFADTTFWHRTGDIVIKAVARDNERAASECQVTAHLMLFAPVNPSPDTIYVPGNFPSIQEALYISEEGDVIMVADGEYREFIHITHPISLIGSGANTVIDDRSVLIESDNVIIKKIKIDIYTGYETPDPGAPGLIIHNSAFVLIDSVIAQGAPFNVWFDPYYPDWPICTDGGPGAAIFNSTNIIVQNSDLTGGMGGDYYCWIGSRGGTGSTMESAVNLFFVSTDFTGTDQGDGVVVQDHSYIGIRNCAVEVNGEGRQYVTDGTSTIIFP